jgi:hypothetical protein
MSARTYGLRTAPAVTRYRKLTFDILEKSVGGANHALTTDHPQTMRPGWRQFAAIHSTARSPIMMTVAWAPPDLGMRGITDASTTDNP